MKLKDWSERLIWATILISVVRYAAAFAASDVGEITGVASNVLTFFLSICLIPYVNLPIYRYYCY